MAVVFVVDPVAWRDAFQSWTGSPVGTYMRAKCEQVKLHSMAAAPGPGKPPRNTTGITYSKGVLEKAIVVNHERAPTGDLEGHVVSLPDHGIFVHEGTRGPYPITPKRPGGFLRWSSPRTGGYVFARRVMHPGIRIRQPFLMEGLERSF